MNDPVDLTVEPDVKGFFDSASNTVSYIVKDPDSSACAIYDTVLDFDYAAGRMSFESADEIVNHVQQYNLDVQWLIETHVHADHLSAAPYLQQRLGGKVGIGEGIRDVQDVFGKVFNEGTEFERDGSQFDHLFTDNDSYMIGGMKAFTLHTPCLLYTSPSPRDATLSRMPSSA